MDFKNMQEKIVEEYRVLVTTHWGKISQEFARQHSQTTLENRLGGMRSFLC